jgi:hypothetical protein
MPPFLELPPQVAAKRHCRVLPPFMIKGAAAMAEDARYLETQFDSTRSASGPLEEEKGGDYCRSMILSLAAKHQIVDLVGNEFASASSSSSSSSSSLRTWPTIESQGKMLLLPLSNINNNNHNTRRRFDFAHLFETHKNYMNPHKQLGAVVLPTNVITCLEDVVELIDNQIVPDLVSQSETLQQMQSISEVSKVFITSSSSENQMRAAVWSIGQPLHRVIIRKVLLEHILATSGHGVLGNEDVPHLVRNLQTMIVNMQVWRSITGFILFITLSKSDHHR